MRISIQLRFFLVAIVGLGTLGIWYPLLWQLILNQKVEYNSIPQNMLTYYISLLLGGSIEYGLKLFDKDNDIPKKEFLDLIAGLFIVGIVSTMAIIFDIKGFAILSYILPLLGIIVAWVLWWSLNVDNALFKTGAALGGDPTRPLKNAK